MWYNWLKEFFQNKDYSNNDNCPSVFIRKSSIRFYIISVHVDDLNIIDTALDINEAHDHLKMEFEMKDLGKTKFFLDRFTTGAPFYVHSHTSIDLYLEKLEKFNMDKAYPSKTPMTMRALEKETDPFQPRQEGEDVLGSEYPYLSVIGALMYLINNTRHDIAFTVN
jgi:hypothetical protein